MTIRRHTSKRPARRIVLIPKAERAAPDRSAPTSPRTLGVAPIRVDQAPKAAAAGREHAPTKSTRVVQRTPALISETPLTPPSPEGGKPRAIAGPRPGTKTRRKAVSGRELRQKLGIMSPAPVKAAKRAARLNAAPAAAPRSETRFSTPPAIRAVRKKLAVPDAQSISSVLLFSEQVGKFSALSDDGAEVIAAFIDGGCNDRK